jgi:hypothetical protein
MIVWQHTLSEFMAGLGQGEGYAKANPIADILAGLTPPGWIAGTEMPIEDAPGFATAVANLPEADKGNQVLLHKTDAGYEAVGAYIGGKLAIADAYRNHDPKLSIDLILRCAEHRPLPTVREDVTIAGYKALVRAHFAAVERAVGAGLDVPKPVLEEYGFD